MSRVAVQLQFVALAATMLVAAGCSFSPRLGNGQLACGAAGDCPPGYQCGSDQRCYLAGTLPMPTSDGGTTACVPLHCFIGWCGPIDDGCGHMIDCGSCNPMSDMAVPVNDAGMSVPVDMAGCVAKKSCIAGTTCGTVDDGCGRQLACGDCAAANTCSSSTANSCACKPKTCSDVGATCGSYPDGCGTVLDCWPSGTSACGPGNSKGSCGGGGPYTCGKSGSCHPLTACPANACGDIADGCAGVLHCGGCTGGKICGGPGKANQCG